MSTRPKKNAEGSGGRTRGNKQNRGGKAQRGTPIKFTREEEGSFGPQVRLVDHMRPIEAGPDFNFVVSTKRLAQVVQAIVAHIACRTGDTNQNHAYAARYLYEWIADKINQDVPPHDILFAPTVVWDLIDAFTPRNNGFGHFHASVGAYPITDNGSGNVITPLGIVSGTTTNNSTTLATTLAAYTAQEGFEAIEELFNAAKHVCPCVRREKYHAIKVNDVSAFSQSLEYGTASVDPIRQYTMSVITTRRSFQCFRQPKAIWLAHLALCDSYLYNTAYPMWTGATLTTPGAIVVHRMIRGFSGYEGHDNLPMIKPVRLSHILAQFNKITSLVTALATTSPFVTAAVNESDANLVFNCILLRWCNSWTAVATGTQCAIVETAGVVEQYRYPANFGTGSGYTKGVESIRNYAFIEENLAALVPYEWKGMWYYPIVYMDDYDFTNMDATGYLTATYNWITHLFGTADIPMTHNAAFSEVVLRWNKAMQISQGYVQISGACPEGTINAASMTAHYVRYEQDGATQADVFATISCAMPVPDDIAPTVDRYVIPFAYSKLSRDVPFWQCCFGEKYSTDVNKTLAQYIQLLEASTETAVHVVAGEGDLDTNRGFAARLAAATRREEQRRPVAPLVDGGRVVERIQGALGDKGQELLQAAVARGIEVGVRALTGV